MKSLLQDGDECITKSGKGLTVEGSALVSETDFIPLSRYNEYLLKIKGHTDYDIIRVIRKGVTIWRRNQPINKMMTFDLNGVEYPIATHENMKILVDRVSELEAKVMELQVKLNEILK